MSMEIARFDAQANTNLNAQGTGQVEFQAKGTNWAIDYVSVTATPHANEPEVRIYVNYVGDRYMVDSTYTGSAATSDTVHHLTDGDRLIIVWTKGDANAFASAVIRGNQEVVRRGFRAER